MRRCGCWKATLAFEPASERASSRLIAANSSMKRKWTRASNECSSLMRIRWTRAAAEDLEHIKDYFTAERLVRPSFALCLFASAPISGTELEQTPCDLCHENSTEDNFVPMPY